MKKVVVGSAILLALSTEAYSQPSAVLLEACNGIKDSKRRLECLKAATAAAPAPAVREEGKSPDNGRLGVPEAATICERVLTGLQPKHALATEDSSKSTDAELAVTWPPSEGKAPTICIVNRLTRKITGVGTSSKMLSGSVVADMERNAVFREEIQAGKYDGFVRFAKGALTQTFKDPTTAQYRGLFISGKALPVLCGEVNAKNSYGGYIGFRRFYASGKPMLNAVEPVRDASVFEGMWPSMCGEKVADVAEQ